MTRETAMPKHFFTFGQSHTHRVNDKTFDCDCVAVIYAYDHERAREIAFEVFGPRWCFSYEEHKWDESKMHYFPRGYLEVNSP